MVKDRRNVKSFAVTNKKPITFKPTSDEEHRFVKFFSSVITENFSMSEELAKAIGTVVVQALTENAKTESSNDDLGDDLDLDLDSDDVNLDESDLPESSRDSGKVQEAEGPKNAPDLSADFAELKGTMSNHSEQHFTESDSNKRYEMVKEYLSHRMNM